MRVVRIDGTERVAQRDPVDTADAAFGCKSLTRGVDRLTGAQGHDAADGPARLREGHRGGDAVAALEGLDAEAADRGRIVADRQAMVAVQRPPLQVRNDARHDRAGADRRVPRDRARGQ